MAAQLSIAGMKASDARCRVTTTSVPCCQESGASSRHLPDASLEPSRSFLSASLPQLPSLRTQRRGCYSHLMDFLYVSGTHWILMSTLVGRYYCPHFTDAEIKALKGGVTYPRWENKNSDPTLECVLLNCTKHHIILRQAPSIQDPVCPCAAGSPSPQLTSPSFHSRPNPDHLRPPGYDDMYL